MLNASNISLPYLTGNNVVTVYLSPYGYYKANDIVDRYRGIRIRNNLIVRIDILYEMKDFFAKETISNEQIREMIYNVFSGCVSHTNQEAISGFVKLLYMNDSVFRVKMAAECYFENDPLERTISMYDVLMLSFKSSYENTKELILKNIKYNTMILDADGYLYVSVNDKIDLSFLNRYKFEVISR